jgi:uncharacterized protein YodC (DUF2158 family)
MAKKTFFTINQKKSGQVQIEMAGRCRKLQSNGSVNCKYYRRIGMCHKGGHGS